ncbi:hypothetical protein PTKIN_Ptkin07bG0054500 [Pterospermum kingtungense]
MVRNNSIIGVDTQIIPFLEDKFLHLNYVLDVLIPHPIHLEILVQALHYWVKDASSLHLLRFSLYEYCNLKSFITPKKCISIFNPRLLLFLYNSHVCEYESIFLFLCSEFLEEFFTEEGRVFSLIFPRVFFTSRKLYRGRIWYLDIICINPLVNHE